MDFILRSHNYKSTLWQFCFIHHKGKKGPWNCSSIKKFLCSSSRLDYFLFFQKYPERAVFLLSGSEGFSLTQTDSVGVSYVDSRLSSTGSTGILDICIHTYIHTYTYVHMHNFTYMVQKLPKFQELRQWRAELKHCEIKCLSYCAWEYWGSEFRNDFATRWYFSNLWG